MREAEALPESASGAERGVQWRPPSTRNTRLDVLRGIAVLLVIGRHLVYPMPEGIVGGFAWAWHSVGWLGVDLFFVLSGFLISGLLFGEYERYGEVRPVRFLLRRGFKIYPPYLALVGYMAVQAVRRGDSPQGTVAAFLPNVLFVQNYLPDFRIGHSWTLTVEEHFYLALPFMFVALIAARRLASLPTICVAAAVACLAIRAALVWGVPDRPAWGLIFPFGRFDALLLGVGIRSLASFNPAGFAAIGRGPWPWLCFACGAALWLPAFFWRDISAPMLTAGLTATMTGAGMLLLGTYHVAMPRWSGAIAVPIAFVGVNSYGIYLWHVTTTRVVEREVGERVATLGPTGAWLVTVAAVIAVSVFVGWVATLLVERPALWLRDRLIPSRSGAAPVPK